jgi:signal transduction histidine kinase
VKFLLDSARPDTGTRTDVRATVATALRLLERHPAFARVTVRSSIPADLPKARIEPDSLKQVVMGLAMNASRAMPGGGTLTFKAARRRSELHLDVTDTGVGVPEAIRGRIFEPYFTTDPARGAGLGLPVARSLVRSRGGDLVFRPRRKGSGFRVILKLAGAS